MIMPTEGPIRLAQVRDQLKLSGKISLDQFEARRMASRFSGRIALSMFKGRDGSVTTQFLTIGYELINYNIRNALMEATGWDGQVPIAVDVTIAPGIWVGSDSTSKPAITTGKFPAGSVVRLINNGTILGAGGAGGNNPATGNGTVGSPGGPAVDLQYPLTIVNNGDIWGGGGGGAGGTTLLGARGGGGGGGAGMPGGIGGSGFNNAIGGLGSRIAGGLAGAKSALGGAGGKGGDPGTAGASAPAGLISILGGAAGRAVNRNGFALTWAGTVGANTSRVKGPVA